MIKVLVCYGTPNDREAFDRHYREVHVPLAQAMPGLREYTVSSGEIVASGERAPYLIAELSWDSSEALEEALASPEGAATTADLESFATGGWWLWRYEERPAGGPDGG